MASITGDIGIAPFFFAWGRCHYDHSVIEQLRDNMAECEVLSEVKDKGGLFARWSGDISMSLGYLLELYMRFTKETAPALDEAGQAWIRAATLLPALEQNRENLFNFLEANRSRNAIHRTFNPDFRHVHIFWHLLRRNNILLLNSSHLETFNVQYVIPLTNEDRQENIILVPSLSLFQQSTHEINKVAIGQPESDLTSLIDLIDESNTSVTDQDPDHSYAKTTHDHPTESVPSGMISKLSLLSGKSHSSSSFIFPEFAIQEYWSQSSAQQAMTTSQEESCAAENWFTGQKVQNAFLESRSMGYEQVKEMESLVTNKNINGSTKALKKEMKTRKTVEAVPGSHQRVNHSQAKQVPLKILPSDVKKALQELKGDAYVLDDQPFPPQFTKDGIQKATTTKSAVKDLLSKEFGLKTIETPSMAEYDGILVDGNFSLYRTPPEKCKNVQQITSWFVYKNIKPMLHRNVTLVMCYDKGKFVTLIKGQERQERWLKNNITNKQDHSLKLLQLYQPGPVLDNNHAPPIGLVRSSRQVRDQYLHCIMKELFSNPSKYLPSNMEFVIVVDGGHALNEDAEDDVPVILYCDGKLLHKLIGFNAVNSHGEAEHVVFFYMLLLSSLVEKWAIISEDADSILKSLATSKERYQINGNSKLHVLVAPKGEHKEFSAYDVDKCMSGIHKHHSLSNFQHPVETRFQPPGHELW